jgi:hypothetical protein
MLQRNNKGSYFIEACGLAGYSIFTDDGILKYSPIAEVEALYESFDPLPLAKIDGAALINQAAGEARTRYITSLPSQDATYQMKLDDSYAFLSAGSPEPNLDSYPFVAAEADANNSTGEQAAELVIATYNQWRQLAATIENIRRKGINAVNAAEEWNQCLPTAKEYAAQLEAI